MGADGERPLLEVDGLASGYGDLRAVWDVSLSVRAGECRVLLGRNGAGKTTTLLAIAGLLPAHAGTVALGGARLDKLPAHARVRAGLGLVQEGKRVFRARTVEENLLLGGYAISRSRRGLRAALAEAYERFPLLGERRHERAGALSGGQQQMLAIAQALVPKPSVLMLDEPSEGLAPAIVKDVLATIAQLKAEGIGVLLVEQLVTEALTVADQVTVVDQGRVSLTGDAHAFADGSLVREVYLGGALDVD